MAWMKVSEALRAQPGQKVVIKGWLRTRRDSKADGGLSFLQVHDGTCQDPIQVVARGDLPNYADEVVKLTTGCAIEAEGSLVASQGQGQSVEVAATSIKVVGWVEDPDTYPVPQKRHTFEYLREVAHLRMRTNTFGAVARVRHTLACAIHRFFDERGFYYIHTPIITASDCEGAGQMFRVSTLDSVNPPRTPEGGVDFAQDFFGREAHLTVSGQLNVETYCCALSRVYTFGPTFRAENSNTSRHLAEFWMIEPEIAFADLAADADLAEEMLKYLFDDLLTRRADDMAFFDLRIEKGLIERLRHIIKSPFRRLPYTEAVAILEKAREAGDAKFEFPVKWGLDLQSEHERYLTEQHFKQPVVLMNYPKQIKAFYMRLNAPGTDGAPGDTVAAMDVLVPGIGEIIGGSQREERLDVLDRRIEEMGLHKDDYWWYRDLRKYGTVPHAGFGLGFERLIQFCTGMQNIRDVIPFPRAPKQAEF
ncbi:MAG: asparagine--tRNA ligase [Leptolyngbya sp. PLA3]|nr:MAG: asparagine--tRNA ligase [Cyanobacteria bacterium CYA]MCE7967786.1 asparagine--tRNA ligase [Leptolyngbya sp. PL-A3]